MVKGLSNKSRVRLQGGQEPQTLKFLSLGFKLETPEPPKSKATATPLHAKLELCKSVVSGIRFWVFASKDLVSALLEEPLPNMITCVKYTQPQILPTARYATLLPLSAAPEVLRVPCRPVFSASCGPGERPLAGTGSSSRDESKSYQWVDACFSRCSSSARIARHIDPSP